MIDPVVFWTFVPAALALNLTPGADMMFCLGQGLRSGPRAAAAASAGISTGSMVHVTLAGLGFGAVVEAAPVLFDAIRWLGVSYLLWLAWGAIRSGAVSPDIATRPANHSFRDGLMVNLTNPKVILFVLAFIPQFVNPNAGSILPQFLIFGMVLAFGGLFINAGVGFFAGAMRRKLTSNPAISRVLGWVSGCLFAALALRLAILERS